MFDLGVISLKLAQISNLFLSKHLNVEFHHPGLKFVLHKFRKWVVLVEIFW